MHVFFDTRTVPAADIRPDDDHCFWSAEPDERLADSIARHGQLTPLLARESDQGMALVSGATRLSVLRELGRDVHVRIVEADTPLDRGLLYLADNGHRPLDDGMRLAALRYFAPLLGPDKLAETIFPHLGIKARSKDAKLLLAWLDLPATWQDHLTAGRVPLAAATVLARLDGDDLDAVEPLFAAFSWSRSNAVNLLTWFHETGRMQDIPVRQVMEQAGVFDLLTQGLSPKDAIARIVTAVRQARYPTLAGLEATFASTARDLTTGTRWRLNQPDSFETGAAELTVRVADRAQLAQALEDLEAMSEATGWDTLFTLGRSDD